MLRHSLVMHEVILPGLPRDWPTPLDLELGLKEVLFLEGVGWDTAEPFLRVAATLDFPLQGEVWYWGENLLLLPRGEMFRLRRQMAYIAPDQVLLHRLTLRENIALTICYHQNVTVTQALQRHQELLDKLALTPYLALPPPELPPEVYWRGLWARELVQEPELVLACLDGPGWTMDNQSLLLEVLQDYLAGDQGAVLLAGRNLAALHSLAHRLLRLAEGRFLETCLKEPRAQSPVAFFPLV